MKVKFPANPVEGQIYYSWSIQGLNLLGKFIYHRGNWRRLDPRSNLLLDQEPKGRIATITNRIKPIKWR
jgi:hypothetical protein